ncbi:MAG: hypothetical protein Fur0024_3620 [Patescibacteria group bacterium]
MRTKLFTLLSVVTLAGGMMYKSTPQVTKAAENQTIDFPQPPVFNYLSYNGSYFGLLSQDYFKATASSGLPVTYTRVSGSCMIGNEYFGLTNDTGTCTVRASQPGGDKDGITYLPATPVERTFAIDLVRPTVDDLSIIGNETTAEDNVQFVISFSKHVNNVDTSDFDLPTNNIVGAKVSSVTLLDPFEFTYLVSATTGSKDGYLELIIKPNNDIEDDNGNPLNLEGFNGIRYKISKGIAPTVPVLVSPKNNSIVPTFTPTLDWGNSKQVMALSDPGWHYEIQVSALFGVYNETFKTGLYDTPEVGLNESSYTIPANKKLPANTTYSWRVRAYNDSYQYSDWSKVMTFRTKLDIPTQVSPKNNETLNTRKPTFRWTPVEGATGYTIQGFKENLTTVAFAGTVAGQVFEWTPTADLLANTTYSWRVKANGTNTADYSEKLYFTTSDNAPRSPVLTLPVNNISVDSSSTQTLKWNPVLAVVNTNPLLAYPEAKSYEVQWSTNKLFSDYSSTNTVNSTIVNAPNVETNIGTLLPGRTYYWRVRSWSEANGTGLYSNWSSYRIINVKFVEPTLISPTNGQTNVGTLPEFSWSSNNGLWTSYTLFIATDPAFKTGLKVYSITAPVTKYKLTSYPLTAGKTYYWKVLINGSYVPKYSQVQSFVA